MKTYSCFAVVMAGMVSPMFGQDTPTSVIDYEARVKSVVVLKDYVAQREQRFGALRADLKNLDARVEERVDYLVKTLAGLKDSKESRIKVATLKGEVIDGLSRSIAIYRQKRMAVLERMRNERTVPDSELAADIDRFDQRIGKRIGQITELAKSLDGYREVPKYERTGSYVDGWYDETVRISDEYKQNRRESSKTGKERDGLMDDLNKAIKNQEDRRRTIADSLAGQKLAATDRTIKEQELGRVDALLDNLRQRRRELAIPERMAKQELGKDEASDIEEMIDDARRDIADDFREIFRKYGDLDKERTRIRELQNNLKAREEWLKKNPPPTK